LNRLARYLRSRRARFETGYGVTLIVSFGSLFYAFTVTIPEIARDLQDGQERFFLAVSAGLILSGLAAPRVGRALDRYGAGPVLVLGTGLSAAALSALAVAPGGIWASLAIGAILVGSTFVLYEAVFAALVQVDAERARRSIGVVTVWGGLASAAFWPLSALLVEAVGWRGTYAVFAVLQLGLCLPIHLGLWRMAKASGGAARKPAAGSAPSWPWARLLRDQRFVLLAAIFGLLAMVITATQLHVLNYFELLGGGAAAIAVAAAIGPAQLAARLSDVLLADRIPALALTRLSVGGMLIGFAALWAGGGSVAFWVVFAVCFGAGMGLSHIARGVLPLAVFGAAQYGATLGALGLIRMVAAGLGPLIFAPFVARGRVDLALIASLGLLAAALGLLGLLRGQTRQAQRRQSG